MKWWISGGLNPWILTCGKVGLDLGEEVLVPLHAQVRVESSLHQDLITPKGHGLANLLEQHGTIEHIGVGVVHLAVEGAEVANRRTDVRIIDIPIDVVRSVGFGMESLADGVGGAAEGKEVGRAEQRDTVFETTGGLPQPRAARSLGR